MMAIFHTLHLLAQDEFSVIILGFDFIGGTPSNPNKMRLHILDGSFLDIWFSTEGDYSYHWEQRRQSGKFYRWDNAPHHPRVESFPAHFHNGEEANILGSILSFDPEVAIRQVLEFVKEKLES